jgi:putative intracellular protease/amidase
MNVLMVLTSHSELGDSGLKTGFWLDEFAAAYYILADAGVIITIACPNGGQPPVDPKSEAAAAQTAATRRFFNDVELKAKLSHSLKLCTLGQIYFDAIFYPGGHGPLWDLANDETSIALIENFWKHNKPMVFVCHGLAALLKVRSPYGNGLARNKNVTGFSNTEEAAVNLTAIVPFLLEDELKKSGGKYSKGLDGAPYTQMDGFLITGQNPASSSAAAELLLSVLRKRTAIKQPQLI